MSIYDISPPPPPSHDLLQVLELGPQYIDHFETMSYVHDTTVDIFIQAMINQKQKRYKESSLALYSNKQQSAFNSD